MKTDVQPCKRGKPTQMHNHAFNNEGMNFEKHFKVHGSLRSTKTNRWYTCVTIGNIWIQYKTVHAYHSLQKKKKAQPQNEII